MIRIEEEIRLSCETMTARSVHPSDYPILREILSDPKTMAYMRFLSNEENGGWSIEDFSRMLDLWRARQKAGLGVYLTLLDPQERIVGMCILSKVQPVNRACEFGLILHHPYWGQGYNPWAYRLVLEYAFVQAGFHRIEFVTLEENVKPRKILEKIGIPFESLREDAAFEEGRFKNDVAHRLLSHEWPSVRSKLDALIRSYAR